MVRIELSAEKAEQHSRMLRRAVVSLENVRRLEPLAMAGATAEMQRSLREVAELLEGGAESEPLDDEVICDDCGRTLRWMHELAKQARKGEYVWICRDAAACRELQEAG